ncbi:hypothetical protein VTI74DRAFT_9175 [Chaetomium olivicolor]
MPRSHRTHSIFDFSSQFAAFVPVDAQAGWLVDHQLSNGVCWGQMYREAWLGRFFASHASDEERWFAAILSELTWRDTKKPSNKKAAIREPSGDKLTAEVIKGTQDWKGAVWSLALMSCAMLLMPTATPEIHSRLTSSDPPRGPGSLNL